MIDLSEISGLPVRFDEETLELVFGRVANCTSEIHVSITDIMPILLNKNLRYPEKVYKHFCNVNLQKQGEGIGSLDYRYDIFVVPYGLLGVEYIKTHIFYNDPVEGKYDCVIEVLSGELTVLLQRNTDRGNVLSFDTFVENVYIVKLKKGEQLVIPTGYFYTFINTSSAPVVFSKITHKNKSVLDYSKIKRERGLAFYLISKNARIEIVPNPKYKVEGTVETLTHGKILKNRQFYLKDLHENSVPLFKHYSQQKGWISKWIHSFV
jgi:oxalate decarboxylase/phosphoglucose isomerase-like protein (cupin superfamily)